MATAGAGLIELPGLIFEFCKTYSDTVTLDFNVTFFYSDFNIYNLIICLDLFPL